MLFGNGLSALLTLIGISAGLVILFIIGPLALTGRELLGSGWPRWLASGGSLLNDAGEQVDWQAPQEAGDYTLTLVVSDGVVRVGQELVVPVQASATVAP